MLPLSHNPKESRTFLCDATGTPLSPCAQLGHPDWPTLPSRTFLMEYVKSKAYFFSSLSSAVFEHKIRVWQGKGEGCGGGKVERWSESCHRSRGNRAPPRFPRTLRRTREDAALVFPPLWLHVHLDALISALFPSKAHSLFVVSLQLFSFTELCFRARFSFH